MIPNVIPPEKRHSGPLHYLGNINLSLPDISGRMVADSHWVNENFSLILTNLKGRRYRKCYEPFSGCASWTLVAMVLDLADEYVINDSNRALIETLKLIMDQPNKIKESYAGWVEKYAKAPSKKSFFLKAIGDYNEATLERKALLLPFIVNTSWSGIIYYDDKANLVYNDSNVNGQIIPGFLSDAALTPDQFSREVDKVSHIFNCNKVVFKTGDFKDAVSDMQAGDFVALCPPYPENTRSVADKTGMYYELYSPDKLHDNLVNTVKAMEDHGVAYFLMYGFHDLKMQKYVIRDASNRLQHHLRFFGYEQCVFGVALDQMYFSTQLSIPNHLRSKFIPAQDILQGRDLTPKEAMASFNKIARELAV